MRELEISDRAYTASLVIGEGWCSLRVAAPIIVAAELRRMAEDPQSLFSSRGDAEILLDRADELDPEGTER